jgi:hypothetical protein
MDIPGLSDQSPQPASAAFRANRNDPIDWFSLRIVRDPPNTTNWELPYGISQPNSNRGHQDLYPLPEAATQKYLNLYFTYFHHRWPIIHSPSFDETSHPSVVVSSMRMIGAWISGTQDSRWLATAMHERLMAHVIPQLVYP